MCNLSGGVEAVVLENRRVEMHCRGGRQRIALDTDALGTDGTVSGQCCAKLDAFRSRGQSVRVQACMAYITVRCPNRVLLDRSWSRVNRAPARDDRKWPPASCPRDTVRIASGNRCTRCDPVMKRSRNINILMFFWTPCPVVGR